MQLYLSGHVHLYERLYPIDSSHQPRNSTSSRLEEGLKVPVFRNPGVPAFIVQGDAGQDYYLRDTPYPLLRVTAFSGLNSGFGVMTIYNSTTLRYERIRAGNASLPRQCFVEDAMYLVQESRSVWFLLAVLGLILILAVLVLARWYFLKRRDADHNPLIREEREEVI